jgi:hypothetical protein
MARRRFRWNPESREMEEITFDESGDSHYVIGDHIDFISPIDKTHIRGRAQYEAHMRQHGVVPTESLKGGAAHSDRYAAERDRSELRAMLWELTDKSMRGQKLR